jgi:hypothetical protein
MLLTNKHKFITILMWWVQAWEKPKIQASDSYSQQEWKKCDTEKTTVYSHTMDKQFPQWTNKAELNTIRNWIRNSTTKP